MGFDSALNDEEQNAADEADSGPVISDERLQEFLNGAVGENVSKSDQVVSVGCSTELHYLWKELREEHPEIREKIRELIAREARRNDEVARRAIQIYDLKESDQ
jgi:hypothetical protein